MHDLIFRVNISVCEYRQYVSKHKWEVAYLFLFELDAYGFDDWWVISITVLFLKIRLCLCEKRWRKYFSV